MNYLSRDRKPYNKYADLHIHTSFSDGILSPEDVVSEANRIGLSAIAITDHDMLDGIEPAILAGERYNVKIIPGVELSTRTDDDEEVHILGFHIDWKDESLQRKLKEIRGFRRFRAMEILGKLSQLGININHNDVIENADSRAIGRPHIASVLVDKGYVATTSEAFYKFLHNGGPAYVAKHKLSHAEAIAMILDAGGVPVLAHPGVLHQNILPELVSCGLMGLEAFHPYHTIQLSDYYCNLARQYKILVTGGSDYHGFGDSKMVMGSIRLPYTHVDDLKKANEYVLQQLNS